MTAIFSFFGGVCLLQLQTELPPTAGLLLLLPPAAIWLLAKRGFFGGDDGGQNSGDESGGGRNSANGKINRVIRFWAGLALAFGCGFWWAAIWAAVRLADDLPGDLVWRDIAVEGIVTAVPLVGERRTRFDFRITNIIAPRSAEIDIVARLSFYRRFDSPPPPLRAGERWRLVVRARTPHGARNPHGFDYGGHLFARGIRLAGYVRNNGETAARYPPQKIAAAAGVYRLHALRHRVRDAVVRALPDDPAAAALLAALVVGDKSLISDAQWQTLRRTGAAHLISISGAHLAIFAALAFALGGALWRRSPRLLAIAPAAKAALFIAVPAAFAYALLAGFALPVRRSFIMLAVGAISAAAGGFSSLLGPLALALAAVIAFDPWAPLAPGFWLSFGVVAFLLFALKNRDGRRGWRKLAVLQISLLLVVLPLTVFFFGEAPLVAPLANLIAVPAVCAIIVPLALADLLAPGDALWRIAGLLAAAGMDLLTALAALPGAALRLPPPPLPLAALAGLGGFWLALPRGFPARICGLVPLAALLLWRPPAPDSGALRATILDVGQGSAATVQTAAHFFLFDAGPAFSGGADAGQLFVLPFLRGEGARRLEAAVISHGDADHSGGAAAVVNALPTAAAFSPLATDHPAIANAGQKHRCQAGVRWRRDGVDFQVIHPRAADYARNLSDNQLSCVVRVSTVAESDASASGALLFTGDIDRKMEKEIAARADVRADVLIAPHHGARDTLGAALLAAVAPRAVIFSAGRGNPFGHPHPDAVARARESGAAVYVTAADGAIRIAIAADGQIRISPYSVRRYWQNPPAAR